jgi:hypothetical protein
MDTELNLRAIHQSREAEAMRLVRARAVRDAGSALGRPGNRFGGAMRMLLGRQGAAVPSSIEPSASTTINPAG